MFLQKMLKRYWYYNLFHMVFRVLEWQWISYSGFQIIINKCLNYLFVIGDKSIYILCPILSKIKIKILRHRRLFGYNWVFCLGVYIRLIQSLLTTKRNLNCHY